MISPLVPFHKGPYYGVTLMSEDFRPFTFVSDGSKASRLCEVLERAGIPVLVEHAFSGEPSLHEFRLYVPHRNYHSALVRCSALEPTIGEPF
jgi:hypothetical protein